MVKSFDDRLKEIYSINELQQRDQWVNRLHPLVKFCISVIYIGLLMSLNKYELAKLISFAVYPFIIYNLANIRVKDALYRMRLVLPLLMAVGIFNPFFDRQTVLFVVGVPISGGIISMITLMLKGLFTVLAAYSLIATTTIEDICYALRCLKMPKVLVTVILLIYRYLFILVEEAGTIFAAYSLRAPSQKGINYKYWGPLVGQWLLRSMDRAEVVYESMCLRGFKGDFFYSQNRKAGLSDFVYSFIWMAILIILRFTNAVYALGGLFVR